MKDGQSFKTLNALLLTYGETSTAMGLPVGHRASMTLIVFSLATHTQINSHIAALLCDCCKIIVQV